MIAATLNPPKPVSESRIKTVGFDSQFSVFARLWSVAMLFHMAHSSRFDKELDYALLTLSAIYVLYRPSLKSFIILIVLQLFDAFFRMPMNPNHWIFMAIVNLTILQALFTLMIRQRSFDINSTELFKTFVSVVRVEVVVLYLLAAFHKLNTGFFTPDSSCAAYLLRAQQIGSIIPLNDSVFLANAYATVIIEFSIPIFLCFRKTRNLAVVIGIIFHGVLSYSAFNAFYDFSSMIFAAYILFTTYDYSKSIQALKNKIKQRRIFSILENDHYSLKNLLTVSAFVIIALTILYILNKKLDTYKSFHLYVFWTPYCALFLYCFIRYMIVDQKALVPSYATFTLPGRAYLVLPIIVFVNGITPYIGLKTENSYSMFSNLRTEGGVSNHFIMPASLQIFNYQKEVVEIVSSTDPNLQKLADNNKLILLFELKNYVKERKPKKIDYLLNGQRKTFDLSNADSRKELGENPYVLYKLMKFRSFDKFEPQTCVH
jgi:hypothetical protein